MLLFDSVSELESLRQRAVSFETFCETSWMKNLETTRPRISMIWVKESDNVREWLVARWVTQD